MRRKQRVVVKDFGEGTRLVFEIQREVPWAAAALADHIDLVRNQLLAGQISPDEAHALLAFDFEWFRQAKYAREVASVHETRVARGPGRKAAPAPVRQDHVLPQPKTWFG